MKCELLKKVIMVSKYAIAGVFLQVFLVGILLAADSNAQQDALSEVDLSINIENQNVSSALDMISAQTGFNFVYNGTTLDLNQKISIKATQQKLYDVLLQISRKANVQFKRVNNNIFVKEKTGNEMRVIEVEQLPAQTRRVTGKVTSLEDDEGLPGVNVIEKGTSNGTVTSVDGSYSLEVSEGATLAFSSVGYTPEEVEIGDRSVIDVVLAQDIKELQELVVIGYGAREKKDVTTSISTVDSKEITKSVAMSPEFAMQGRMTGVHVSGNTGNPMDRPTVRIRGTNTWGVADPLYVIDGVPVTELGGGILGQENSRIRDVRGPVNIMSMINPNDI
ncbi:MAG: carboxypeptidase-like regulatory domain-containing protein [Cyclobacteriaceae bacterium]